MPLVLSSKRFVGLVREASYGVGVTTGTHWLPASGPKVTPDIKYSRDNALRGIAAMDFGAYQGVKSGAFKYTLPVYVTDTPVILPNIVGPDTVTGTTAPYTHTFTLASGEPTSLTIHDFDGIDQNKLAGSMISQASFKLDPEQMFSVDIQGQSIYPSPEGSSVPSFATEQYYLGWEGSLNMNSVANVNLVTFQLDLKRKLTPRWSAQDSQIVKYIFTGALEVNLKATFDVADDTEFNLFNNNTTSNFTLTMTHPTGATMVFQMSQMQFITGEKISSKDWIQTDLTGVGIYNATDGGNIKVTCTNSAATAY